MIGWKDITLEETRKHRRDPNFVIQIQLMEIMEMSALLIVQIVQTSECRKQVNRAAVCGYRLSM